ncbi:hypothetical protein HF086_008108 [Spodoptera exigua]|uniref:Uncharacterized protein n=1 Tax=Spodoptera exigua TaxID=7107 RepID=A0A922MNQ9_SPOEX|nr:hypothetical protein HF086_008108 [Spodoptera exigua]
MFSGMYSTVDQQIKSEPRDRTPPHHNISSPPLHGYAPQYEQNWPIDNMQGGLGVPGPSHSAVPAGHGNPFAQEMWQNQPYGQVSPAHLQPSAMAQNLQVLQPSMQAMSPSMQPMSPNMQPLSPNMQAPYVAERMSPNMAVMSPHGQTMSPNMQVMSPMGRVSPNMPQNMGHISPNLVQHQTTYAQQGATGPGAMETEGHSAASLSHLLMDRGGGGDSLLLNSSELSGLSDLLNNTIPQ